MRVAFVLRSAEVQPLFRDLCDAASCLDSFPSQDCASRRILSPLHIALSCV